MAIQFKDQLDAAAEQSSQAYFATLLEKNQCLFAALEVQRLAQGIGYISQLLEFSRSTIE